MASRPLARATLLGSAGLLAFSVAGYPLALAALRRLRNGGADRSPAPYADPAPSVAMLVAAHDEEGSIGEWVRMARRLEYPRERLRLIVASDGSSDATAERAREAGADAVLELGRGGKVAALHAAIDAAGDAEVLAFSDANSVWEPDALRLLCARLARPGVGYVCGQLRLTGEGGENQEGLYWRYEMAVRELESGLAGITAGNGAINAVRRDAFPRLETDRGLDISLPFELAKRGWRSEYEPGAIATEPMATTIGDEFGRKRRMLTGSWRTLLSTGILSPRGYAPLFWFEILSHRLLRYAAPLLHLAALGSSVALRRTRLGRVALAAQLGVLGLAIVPAAGGRLGLISRYYVSVQAASALGLWDFLTRGTPRTWSQAAGTRGPQGGTDALAPPGLPRVADVALAALGLLVASPVIAAAAVAIRLGSPGPVLYRQRRAGLSGEPFEMLKLRTMRTGADPVGVGKPVLAGDPMVTAAGHWLRRFSLDELPNLVNVLRGEMAIVGPRPTLEAQVELYTDHQRRRLDVLPGITGWAQINGRAEIPWPERIELDVWYVENRTPGLDARILARTAAKLVTGQGLYG